jgi:hypothetical protein
MAVLCLLTNTPWPWPTPAEAASARGEFPTLGTKWRGRSEAEVCTSEARKTRVPLARARGGASQEGLVSLLGAERMRSRLVVAVAMGLALRAGTRSLRNSVQEMVDGRKCSDASRIWNRAFRRCVLLRVKERFRQFGYAEHVRDAFDVVCHRREAEFSPCTGQPAHQQTRMPEDPVLDYHIHEILF